jgi:hypothetical protein
MAGRGREEDAVISAHAKAQAVRFARVAALALLAQLLLTGFVWPGWAGLWSLLIGAAEVGLREMRPVKPIGPGSSPPASTSGAGGG